MLTWHQVDNDARYTRHKTGVPVEMEVAEDLRKALEATPRVSCGAAGIPCPRCNQLADGETPRMPDDFKVESDKDGWRR
jgi:hypothetical protein